MMRWLGRALKKTAGFWSPLRRVYRWVERAAEVLSNHDGHDAMTVRRRFDGVLSALGRSLPEAGKYRPALKHFLRITHTHRPYLFACYAIEGLPRTNNDLEQLFGRFRYHERRASGRKVAAPSTVVRGRARLVASIATNLRRYEAQELVLHRPKAWRQLRRELAAHQHPRTLGRRFRRQPAAYLAALEERILKAPLPP